MIIYYFVDFGEFDFIVVGSGSAGSVVATRLSEISSWRILLLEAGGEENEFSSIPAMLRETLSSDLNWGYFSVPQKNGCLGKHTHIFILTSCFVFFVLDNCLYLT